MAVNGGDIVVTLSLEDGDFKVGIDAAGQSVEKFARRMRRIDDNVARAERRMRGFTSTLRDWTLILGQARNALNQFAFVTTDWMRSIVDANREVERLTFLMKGLSDASTEAGRMKEATDTVKELFDLAKSAPFQIQAIADSFVKMKAVGLDPMNLGLQSLLDGVAAFGGTNDILKRASIAVQQMAGKGVISMEELRQQMGEAVPRSIELMARSLGMTFGDLVEKISKGTVEANTALRAMFMEFERVFGGRARDLMQSFNGQWAKLVTNLTELVSQTPGMKEFFMAVTDGLKSINAFLVSPLAQKWANDLGYALAAGVEWVKRVVQAFYEWRHVIYSVGKALAAGLGIKLVTSLFGALIGTVTRATAVFRQHRAALATANAASQQGITATNSLAASYQRLGPVARTASFAIRGIGRAAMALLGPLGMAVTAIWTLIEALNVFGSTHKQVLAQILEGEMITNTGQIKERADAIAIEREELEKLAAAEEKAASRIRVARERYNLDEDDPRMRRLRSEHQLAKQAADEARTKLTELETKHDELVANYRKIRAEGAAEAMIAVVDSDLQRLQTIFDEKASEIDEETASRSKERIERTLAAQKKLYEGSIDVYEGFIDRQQERLLSASEEDRLAILKSISTAEQEIRQLRERMESSAGLLKSGPKFVTGQGKDGDIKRITTKILSAEKQFARATLKIQADAARLHQELMDPLAFTMPKAVDQLRIRLTSILEPLRQIAPKSAEAAAALRKFESVVGDLVSKQAENEVAKIMLAMRERTKEIRRGLMREEDAREAAFQDEVERLMNMRDVLKEQGLWRVEYEEWLQEQIQALRDKTDRENETNLDRWLRSWEDFGRDLEDLMGDTFGQLSGLLTDWIMEGKLKLGDFARTLLKSFLNIAINAGLSAMGKMAGLGNLFHGGGIVGRDSQVKRYSAFHGGGIVGQSGGMARTADPAVFAGAPRFHTGGIIGSDEVPAILKKKEGVFTPEQMKAIGAGMGGPDVQVNVINNTDREMDAQQGKPRFDGERMVLDVVLKNAARPGSFRDNLKAALK